MMLHESVKIEGRRYIHIMNEFWTDEGCFRWSYLNNPSTNEVSLLDANGEVGKYMFSTTPLIFWLLVKIAMHT